jgi:dihydrofolate reductase
MCPLPDLSVGVVKGSCTMARLIVTEFVSLDGVMQAPGGEPGYAHTGWAGERFTDELFAYKLEEQLAAEVLLLGRVTYESFFGAWPDREGAMAEKINTMPKYVASRTLPALQWKTARLLEGPAPEAVAELKARTDGSILVIGSRTLVHTLLDAGLVDQLSLQVFPLILGSGDRLFPERPDATSLTLTTSQVLASGVVLQEYDLVPAERHDAE